MFTSMQSFQLKVRLTDKNVGEVVMALFMNHFETIQVLDFKVQVYE